MGRITRVYLKIATLVGDMLKIFEKTEKIFGLGGRGVYRTRSQLSSRDIEIVANTS